MSKSAREDRPWKYSGQFRLGSPVMKLKLEQQIIAGCRCYACEANRQWLKQMNEKKERLE